MTTVYSFTSELVKFNWITGWLLILPRNVNSTGIAFLSSIAKAGVLKAVVLVIARAIAKIRVLINTLFMSVKFKCLEKMFIAFMDRNHNDKPSKACGKQKVDCK